MSDFKWSEKSSAAAVGLAFGKTQQQVADEIRVARRTVERWAADTDFSAEVDRLSLMVGIAGRAERLRLAMRVVRQKTREDGRLDTERDLLDWLRFAQSETDGVKLDLTALFEAQASVADQRQDRTGEEPEHAHAHGREGQGGKDRRGAGGRKKKVR